MNYIGNQSECGRLQTVIMHRPGNELKRLRSDNLDKLLYDAVPKLDDTHRSHDIFSQYLRGQGIQVLYVKDLLLETLIHSELACYSLVEGIIHNFLSTTDTPDASSYLQEWLVERTPQQLVEDVICGVASSRDELGSTDNALMILQILNPANEFVLPPLPNLLFTRDAFSIIEKNVFVWKMAKPARQNEPLIFDVIFQYHPHLSNSGLNIINWQSNEYENATVEGGDVAYIGDGLLLIGCGERTNPAGIEAITRTGLFRQVIAVMLPPQRDYMHLDTVLSSVGAHAFTLHGLLANQMEIMTVKTHDENNNEFEEPQWTSYGSNVCMALQNLLDNPNLIFYDAGDIETSIIEQRECRHNVLALDECFVLTYDGGHPQNGIAAQMTSRNACRVHLIPTQGLLEGCGGMHCMTNALERQGRHL